MFGEKPIYGQSVGHTDKKCRICLPSFTEVSSEDDLIIMKDAHGYRVVDAQIVDEYIQFLETKYREELDFEKQHEIGERLLLIYESIVKHSSCDKQHRIILSEFLEPESEYLIIGCRTSVLLKPNKEHQKKLGYQDKESKPNL